MKRSSSLFFLPGAGGDPDAWRPVADRLRHPGRRRFFAWPGFAGAPADPRITSFDDLVSTVVEEITAPVALFAQSMGGVVAVRAALAKPDLVRHLVLAVTSGGVDVASLGGADWRPAFRARHPEVPPWFLDERTNLADRLAAITIPVLLLWGDADTISPIAVGETLRGLLPKGELVVIGGGTHNLIVERADEVAAHVNRHLRT